MAISIEEVKKSLERVQEFDANSLAREKDLGVALSFHEAIEPTQRIINLFRQFPSQYVSELPTNRLNELKSQSDGFYNILDQILKFDAKQSDPNGVRNNIINTLNGQYEQYFNSLIGLISYGASRLRDFSALERDARAKVQSIADKADELTGQLKNNQEEAKKILDDVRRTAAEHGVSQQAIYFQNESQEHEKEAEKWRKKTSHIAIALGIFAVISATLHKWPWLVPSDTYSAFQLGISKILIFAVIAYMLALSARNFLSHKHNAIVNKHRQNALLTFNALANAAKESDNRDIVLNYAASCIFSPQDTGYTKNPSGSVDVPSGIIQTLPKITSGTGHS